MTDQKSAKPRRHSEKRQRTKATTHRWLKEEFNAVSRKARDAGLSFGAYVRAAALGDAGPRAQRRLPVVEENVLHVLALHARYGNNLNQVAYQLNARGDFNGAARYEKALDEWGEIRESMLELLKREPEAPSSPAAPKIKSSFLPPGDAPNNPKGA